MFYFTELRIKQEEIMDEAENSSPAAEEIGQTGDEGVAPEESMVGSPSDTQDGLSGPNLPADTGNRQSNGKDHVLQNRNYVVGFKQFFKLLQTPFFLSFSYPRQKDNESNTFRFFFFFSLRVGGVFSLTFFF